MLELNYHVDAEAEARFEARRQRSEEATAEAAVAAQKAEEAAQSFRELRATAEAGEAPEALEWATAAAEAEYAPLVAGALARKAQSAARSARFTDLEYGEAVAQNLAELFPGMTLTVSDRLPANFPKKDLPVVHVLQENATEHIGRRWVGGSAKVVLVAGNSLTRGPAIEDVQKALSRQSAKMTHNATVSVEHSTDGDGRYLTQWNVSSDVEYGPIASPFPSRLTDPIGEGGWQAKGAELAHPERILSELVNGGLYEWMGGDHATDIHEVAVGNPGKRKSLDGKRYVQTGTVAIVGAGRQKVELLSGTASSVEASISTRSRAEAQAAMEAGGRKLLGMPLPGSGTVHQIEDGPGAAFPVRKPAGATVVYLNVIVGGTEAGA
ncbi:MAG: hypothetical protein QM582_05655 [Micropruina sp.]|uniref:hypothetical protein n=1 Tax=Micropruina sp. TaxID=2737536 RepID=UPI0039E58095